MTDLSRLTKDTLVSFPSGGTTGTSNIVYAQPYDDNKTLIIVEQTPFHPLSCSWPDQQADTGALTIDGIEYTVSDTLTAAIDLEGNEGPKLLIDTAIPSRHNANSWRFFVAHIAEGLKSNQLDALVDKTISLKVDEKRRLLLSSAHTATHLVALALNKHTTDLWRKEADLDGLGHPDLDKLAMEKSTITPGQATDVYRFGKSLRKKYGFEADKFIQNIEQINNAVKQQAAEWLASSAKITIEAEGPTLEARRRWVCELDGKMIKFPCGGTHLTSLGQLKSIDIVLEPTPEGMTMYTTPKLKEA